MFFQNESDKQQIVVRLMFSIKSVISFCKDSLVNVYNDLLVIKNNAKGCEFSI